MFKQECSIFNTLEGENLRYISDIPNIQNAISRVDFRYTVDIDIKF